jgi:hypothetical protein
LVDNAHSGYFSYGRTGDLRLKLRTRAAAYGVAGLALAGVVIFSGSALGLLSASSSGILSVLLTDPPSVPSGVSAVYVTYSSIAVHASGFNDSGWVSFSGGGTIDTMKLVNFSQTISSGVVPSLTYDLVEFNISNVAVDYMGTNYSVTVASGKLIVPIVGGVKVDSSNPAAALIDIQPTVLNLGDQTSPSFTMAAGAKALQVPSDEVSDSMRHVGNNYSLEGHSWFQTFKQHHSDDLTVSGLVLASGTFSFSVANEGSDPATIRMAILTPIAQGEGSGMMTGSAPNSIFFVVQPDGSLRLVNGTPGQVESFLGLGGYSLAAGASHSFSFTGTITSLLGKHGISSRSQYNVVLIGSETVGSQMVTAP